MRKNVNGYMGASADRGVYIPHVLIPLWQMKLREIYGIEVDREIIKIALEEKYSRSTWKWSRAVKRIEDILTIRGISRENATKIAKSVVKAVSE